MKKNIILFLLSVIGTGNAARQTNEQFREKFYDSLRLTDAAKAQMAQQVKKLIFKNKAAVVAEIGTLASCVLALKSELLTQVVPSYFVKSAPTVISIANPDKQLWKDGINFFIVCAHAVVVNKCLSMMYERGLGFAAKATWNFTLKSFLQQYTSLYTIFELLESELSSIMLQEDPSARTELVKGLEYKIATLAHHMSYIDGYVLVEIERKDKNAAFISQKELEQEYQSFDAVRNSVLLSLITAVAELKYVASQENFHDAALNAMSILQQSSQKLIQRINALDFAINY